MNEEGYDYYESSMNYGIKYSFDINESMATFHNKTFLEQIKHNLDFYEMSIKELSVSTRISEFRLNALLNGNADFEHYEVDLIKKRLHIK